MAKNVQTPVCGVCGKQDVLTMTDAEWAALQSGVAIQVALPNWSPAMREELKTGYHPQCWEELFPKCTLCGETWEGEDDVEWVNKRQYTHKVCPDWGSDDAGE